MLGPLRQRSTTDLIVLTLAIVVAIVVVSCTFFVLIVAIAKPDANLAEAFKRVVELCNSLIALLVGYVAGRGATNGKAPEPGPGQEIR